MHCGFQECQTLVPLKFGARTWDPKPVKTCPHISQGRYFMSLNVSTYGDKFVDKCCTRIILLKGPFFSLQARPPTCSNAAKKTRRSCQWSSRHSYRHLQRQSLIKSRGFLRNQQKKQGKNLAKWRMLVSKW